MPKVPKYTKTLTCPTTATHANRATTDLEVAQGKISQVTVTWTPGSQWLNALVIMYEGAQIIPAEGAGECRGDGYPDIWPEHIILDKTHPKLNLEVWNDGNDYEHEAKVDIIILPYEPEPLKPVTSLVKTLKRMLGL